MKRVLIVANRLPVSIEYSGNGKPLLTPSVGGLATGLRSLHETHESIWIGWADIDPAHYSQQECETIRTVLAAEHGSSPVFLSDDDVQGFYYGLCNRTIWPLFHHFTQYAEFDSALWKAYERVNRIYCDAVLEHAQPGDTIWIHDYQLMLLPALLRERLPDATIGWFLHIPFPCFDVFRMLPWRKEVLLGLLGADLIGFHTYDYALHFLEACRRLLGYENQLGRITIHDRVVLADAFPMGIDYERYHNAGQDPIVASQANRVRTADECRIILSVDRLDYTKGIPERLRAFDAFLERYPEWHGRIKLICVAVPSRESVETYRQLKTEVDGLVGSINGKYATIDWTPIDYLYRSLPFETLCGMYRAADVALVTPLSDGMNLIAKEYLATHDTRNGVLVLSEMAGAARELGEALIVNPYDQEQVISTLQRALSMPEKEIIARNTLMQRRLQRYTVSTWAREFLVSLENVKAIQRSLDARRLDESQRTSLITEYAKATHRVLLLDYDGTLVDPSVSASGKPPRELRNLLARLTADPANDIVVLSGRGRKTLDKWLGDLDVHIVAEHGVWLRGRHSSWVTVEPLSNEWKARVLPMLEMFVDRTPGSYVEEHEHSLVWNYRAVDTELSKTRTVELNDALASIVHDLGLSITNGTKTLELKAATINKGQAAHRWMCQETVEFILIIGNDRTDEDMFEVAPETAWTIKVSAGQTAARHSVHSVHDVWRLLTSLAEMPPGTES